MNTERPPTLASLPAPEPGVLERWEFQCGVWGCEVPCVTFRTERPAPDGWVLVHGETELLCWRIEMGGSYELGCAMAYALYGCHEQAWNSLHLGAWWVRSGTAARLWKLRPWLQTRNVWRHSNGQVDSTRDGVLL